jgi:hypothetical protein
MSEPRRHHLVPQMHLKRFADHKRRIVMVSRDQKKRLSLNINQAYVQTDYYAVETGNGRSQEVEKLLSHIESEATTAIERMLSGKFPPSPDDRAAVAMFIGFQCLRGDEHREGYEQVFDTLTKMMLANTTRKDVIEHFRKDKGRDPTEEEITDEKRFLSNLDEFSIKPHQNDSIRLMLEIAPDLAEYMVQRAWILVDHGEPCLLTSDSPVVRWSDPTGPGRRWGQGWATADEIQMPLSPRHSLILVRNEELEDQVSHLGSKIGPELGAKMNELVAYSARRWIFHHPDMDPLKGITLPPIGPVLTIEGATGRMIPDDW